MALFRFGHAQKNAFASLIALTLGQIAIGLRSLDFGLPVARDHGDCFMSILRIACHTRLKRKDLQTAQQKLSERQRRGIHIKGWGNAPGLRKSENISAEGAASHQSLGQRPRIMEIRKISAESAIHSHGEFDARIP
jgi:hypothetical protein